MDYWGSGTSLLIAIFGENNLNILYALVILVALDYITGVCVAIKRGKVSSSIGAKGIAGKVMIFALVSLSNIFDMYFLAADGVLEAITILFYCVNESISILENASKMDVPIPRKLKETLEKLKEDKDKA